MFEQFTILFVRSMHKPGHRAGEKGGNMKDTRLNIRISSELKKQAQELAAKDGRTLANWLEQLIRKEIEKAAEK